MGKELALKNLTSLGKDKTALQKAPVITCLGSMLLTAFILLLSYILLGFAPFGDKALLYKDGQQQMVDLFCWYKDVLTGRSSIDYTFTKYLGGSNFAVFTYYLSSPFSLLIVFFDKSQVSLFMNILYLLKASFAALFAGYYICRRFKPDTLSKYAFTVILATSYALNLYMISQSSNVMWLDGVYMLPLILAGVEKLVDEKKSTLFVISAGLGLIFNWYVGIINLMFAGIWLFFETARKAIQNSPYENKKEHPVLKMFGASIVRFAIASVSTLLISAVILLPTLTMLSGRSYGHSGLSMLTDFSVIGLIPNVISNYSFGIVSLKGSVNLFAGSLVFFGVIMLFFSVSKKLKEKILYGCLLLFTVLAFYWQPLVAVFSMLREVESFWYRYSYVGSFALVYLAAVFFLECDLKKIRIFIPPCIAAVYALIVFLMTDKNSHPVPEVLLTAKMSEILSLTPDYYGIPLVSKIVFPVLTALVLCLIIGAKEADKSLPKPGSAILALILITELVMSQNVLGRIYSTDDGPFIDSYTTKELELLDKIDDPSFYRVVQTTYHSYYHELAGSYSEPMAYGFNSVTAFVSAPDENSVWFLDRAGYPGYYDTIPVTESENIALDSLLSVKYVLLPAGDKNTEGLQKMGGVDGFKDIYLNPYAVPAAFVIDKTGSYESSKTDPALYLNDVYKHLSGVEKDIFIPVAADSVTAASDETGYTYLIGTGSDEGVILYANLITDTETGAELYMNGEKFTAYSEEMAPKMIRIQPVNGKAELKLVFKDSEGGHKVTDALFYTVDKAALAEASEAIKSKAASKADIRDGHCRFEVSNASAGTSLFMSVPYNKGWTITRNGHKIDVDLTCDTFITIPLENGGNVIEMNYRVPHLTAGIIASVMGIVLLAGITVFESRKKEKISK